MIYRFYDGAPDKTVSYVETILPLIGNVTEFEVFRNQEDTPYVVMEDDEKKLYTFILKDNNDNEFWLYTLCGYHGSGPNATLKILQLLGLKEDFEICEEENTHIRKKNLKPIHKLNLMIVQDKAEGYSDEILEHNSMISIDFKYAYQKHNLIKVLRALGYMQHVLPNDRTFYEKAYLFDNLEVPEYEYYYYTNYILTLNRRLRNFSFDQVQALMKEIIKNNGGNISYEAMIKYK
ncbi:hypothetical protein UT300019_09080 [Clostridium sp. CTA-19]